jgi:hypothetical protein
MNIAKSKLLKRIAELEGRRRRGSLARLSDDDLEQAIIAAAADLRGQPLTSAMKAALAKVPPAHECRVSEFDRRVLHSLSDEEFLIYVDAGVAQVKGEPVSEEAAGILARFGTSGGLALPASRYPRPASH